MGHIANKIDAKDKKLSEVFIGQRYKIDYFQREYRWQKKHIEALISDLSISFLKNYRDNHTIENYSEYDCYYMGPIVLCEERNELSIVDGQQRLTSFTLLLIYLLHAQEKLNLPSNYVKDLKPYIYVTKGGKTTLVLNVDIRKEIIEYLYTESVDNYKNINLFEKEDVCLTELCKTNDESIQNIIARYEDIKTLFPPEINNIEKLPLFIEWLLDKVILVEVKAYSMDNAYSIFESMNDRGLTLNPTEILKGFLLSKIDDEFKSDELNVFWKERIAEVKSISNSRDVDLDFFRAWLRAKYAISTRSTKIGAENEDFELIGTNFHTWVKNNLNKLYLKDSEDYYFFIRSDFDFYSKLFKQLYDYKNKSNELFENLYISSFYPLADSLSYPLLLSSISKIDEEKTIEEKINIVSKFLDVYTNTRSISGKPITQSSIRYAMYDLVKSIRNSDVISLKSKLNNELKKTTSINEPIYNQLHNISNWNYYHYFFARIVYHLSNQNEDFNELMRSRKQKSYILMQIFDYDHRPVEIEDEIWFRFIYSVANHCLVRRTDVPFVFESKNPNDIINRLLTLGYLPEIKGNNFDNVEIIDFIKNRDIIIHDLVDEIWAV